MISPKMWQQCSGQCMAHCRCWPKASRQKDLLNSNLGMDSNSWMNDYIALLKPGSMAIHVHQFFVLGSCPVHFWVLRSPPVFYSLHNGVPQLWKPEMFYDIDKCSLGDKKNYPWLQIISESKPGGGDEICSFTLVKPAIENYEIWYQHDGTALLTKDTSNVHCVLEEEWP